MGRLIGAVCLLTASALAANPLGEATAQSEPSDIPGAAQLADALVRNHIYLFNDSQYAALREINHRFGEADLLAKKTEATVAKREAVAMRRAAAEKLLALLNSLPCLIPVTVSNKLAKTSITSPVALPGDVGALVLRIQSGSDETRCVTVSHDLSGREERIPVEIAPAGVTWALVELSNVPVKRTSLVLQLEGVADRWIPLLVEVATMARGRLSVTVLSADSGGPTPAMVRLVWKTDGRDRKPSNAIEFAPQMDNQGDPADPRGANLPGRLVGDYWCVPGPFDMTVPAGEWEITIRRGVEHIPIFDTFTVNPGQVVEKTYQPLRWVDMRKLGWYSGDDHVHARILSDSDAKRVMAWVQAEDVHMANILKMGDINRTWFEQRGFGPAYRVIDGDYVLTPGQECPRTHEQLGHILSINTRRMVRDTDHYYLYDRAFDAVHAQGGLSGYAHVESNDFHVDRDMSINVPKNMIDFVEVMQFGRLGTELYYDFLNLGFKLTASAGSDVPWGGTFGEVRMYAYVGHGAFSPDAWFAAVKRGRTFVTNGPMIDFHVDEAMPGDEIIIPDNRAVHIRARAWGDPGRMVPTTLQIVCHGEVIRSIESSNGNHPELSLEFALPAEHGFWIAAHATGSDGSEAHTTPVYVIRNPLRFWKHSAAEELIRKRLDSLTEVERVVATARQLDREGRVEYHRPWRQMALQGPELLTRVAAARRFYEDLARTAERERTLRTGSE